MIWVCLLHMVTMVVMMLIVVVVVMATTEGSHLSRNEAGLLHVLLHPESLLCAAQQSRAAFEHL